MMQPLLFPLNRISQTDVAALQFSLRAPKLLQAAFMQQRSLAVQGRLVPDVPVNFPWNAIGQPALVDMRVTQFPLVVHNLLPIPPTFFQISGQTKDSTGAALGTCVATLFVTATDLELEKVTSGPDGYFYFKSPTQGVTHYIVAYKAGSPDVSGTTVNTLVGA